MAKAAAEKLKKLRRAVSKSAVLIFDINDQSFHYIYFTTRFRMFKARADASARKNLFGTFRFFYPFGAQDLIIHFFVDA